MEYSALLDYTRALRRDFHRRPELSMQEHGTARRILEELSAMGLEPRAVCGTGVTAELRGGLPGKTVLLRADIDALPVQEETGLPFASEHPGVMHACGHDAHGAMLLGAARLLVEGRASLRGTVRLLFEPGEEVGGAGRRLVEGGILDGVDAVFALHVCPELPRGTVNISPGPRMAGCGFFSLKLTGAGGHGSAPHKGVDVIPAAAALVQSLQCVVSREVDPLESAVLSVGTLRAGTAANVIAAEAELTGTLRYYAPALREQLPQALERIIAGMAAAHRVHAELKCGMGLPPVVNHPDCADLAARSAVRVLGRQAPAELRMATGSDDYALYLERRPGVYAFLGTALPGGGEAAPIHHPRFDLDEEALPLGSRLHAQFAQDFLNGEAD